MKGEGQREKLAVAATELANARADAQALATSHYGVRVTAGELEKAKCGRASQRLDDHSVSIVTTQMQDQKPEISAGSQHKAALQYAPARISGTDMAKI